MRLKSISLVLHQISQRKLRKLHKLDKRIKKFAWFPVMTNTHIIIWLDYYWKEYIVSEYPDYSGIYSLTAANNFIHKKGE